MLSNLGTTFDEAHSIPCLYTYTGILMLKYIYIYARYPKNGGNIDYSFLTFCDESYQIPKPNQRIPCYRVLAAIFPKKAQHKFN